MDNLLFARVQLNKLDKQLAVDQLSKIDKKHWFWDPYRATNMLPLMTRDSVPGAEGSSNSRDGDFKWLPYTPEIIKTWFEDQVFPWMGMKTRIMALLTVPNFSNNEHIDCDLSEIGTKQHKFRIVLKGRTGTLYFKTKTGDVAVPDIEDAFVMDGGWPHGMINDSDEFKLTIAAGAPWIGNDSYDNVDVMLTRSEFQIPDDVSEWLKKK